ncbi:hypothetical protein HMPREF1199_01420 [Hoylesella oralis CC98A]|nr:hypothetical protein HMPREF1199_01420 [Hoylesella oralis CC98A]
MEENKLKTWITNGTPPVLGAKKGVLAYSNIFKLLVTD